jgi:hypothetical protein
MLPPLKRIVAWMWIPVVIAAAYLAYTAWFRYDSNRRIERVAEGRQQRGYRAASGPGGSDLKILQFYSGAGELTAGEHAVVCYGVQNAVAVRIEPPVEELKPAFNRCFAVEPQRDTTYTLTAEDAGGKQVSASFSLKVNPPPPYILFVSTSDAEIRRGQMYTVCYGVRNAQSVRLEPFGMKLPPSPKNCVQLFPPATMKLTLLAEGNGKTDRERWAVTVR